MVSEELQPLIPIVTLVRQKSQWFITKGFNHQWLQWFITKGCNHLPIIVTITNICMCSSKQLQCFNLMVARIHLNIQQKRAGDTLGVPSSMEMSDLHIVETGFFNRWMDWLIGQRMAKVVRGNL